MKRFLVTNLVALLKLRHTHPLAVTFLLFFLPADLYLFISLAFCSGSHSVAVATFKNATLQCAMCTFTYTFFSSSCSDEGWVICVTGQDDACQGMVSSMNTAGTVAGLVQHEHWACWPVWEAEAHCFNAAPCSFRDRGAAAVPCGHLCIVCTGSVPMSSNHCSCLPAHLDLLGRNYPHI